MKTILTLICASLLFAAPAQAWTHRFHVPPKSEETWTTPQYFSWTDSSVIKVRVNGFVLGDTAYRIEGKRRCRLGWARPRLVIDASIGCGKRNRVTYRISNFRHRSARVKISYWFPKGIQGGNPEGEREPQPLP